VIITMNDESAQRSPFAKTAQVIGWGRGRPARNTPKLRKSWVDDSQSVSALRAHCGRDARGPTSLDRFHIDKQRWQR